MTSLDPILGLDLHIKPPTLGQFTRPFRKLIATYRSGAGLTPRLSIVLGVEPGHQQAKHVLHIPPSYIPITPNFFVNSLCSPASTPFPLKQLLYCTYLCVYSNSISLNPAHLKDHVLLSNGTMPTPLCGSLQPQATKPHSSSRPRREQQPPTPAFLRVVHPEENCEPFFYQQRTLSYKYTFPTIKACPQTTSLPNLLKAP